MLLFTSLLLTYVVLLRFLIIEPKLSWLCPGSKRSLCAQTVAPPSFGYPLKSKSMDNALMQSQSGELISPLLISFFFSTRFLFLSLFRYHQRPLDRVESKAPDAVTP
ncbi:hypothetical protein QR685DRAFT_295108 [Neurospora intermedia]|uniref:Uncharacterized protein n=1 Tax=Neurospora intermedia TaxID=5142 RepID=A0ABR3DAB2_NEUIN